MSYFHVALHNDIVLVGRANLQAQILPLLLLWLTFACASSRKLAWQRNITARIDNRLCGVRWLITWSGADFSETASVRAVRALWAEMKLWRKQKPSIHLISVLGRILTCFEDNALVQLNQLQGPKQTCKAKQPNIYPSDKQSLLGWESCEKPTYCYYYYY